MSTFALMWAIVCIVPYYRMSNDFSGISTFLLSLSLVYSVSLHQCGHNHCCCYPHHHSQNEDIQISFTGMNVNVTLLRKLNGILSQLLHFKKTKQINKYKNKYFKQ